MKSRKTIVGKIAREVLQFTAGKDVELDHALVDADCIGSAAHVTMLAAMPLKPALFSKAQKKALISELVAVMRKARRGSFEITLEDQDVHMAVERVLTSKLGDLGKKIHTARSRNDQVAVDMRLYGKEQLLSVAAEATGLALALLAFARKNQLVPMVGRTHLQPAMPSSVGLWASAHAEALLDDMKVVGAAYEFNDRCPLGSAAGYGVNLPINRKLTSKLLGFAEPIHNVLYASSARGKNESVILSAMAQVMLTLSRLAEDMVLFSMPEFGYFKLPAEYCTGSSIMPQKRNPDVAELVRAKSAAVLSCAMAAMTTVKGLPSGYNRDLQEIKAPFMEGLGTTLASLRIMRLVVERLEANKQALKNGFTPDVFATDRALELVAGGMPFRDAYDKVKSEIASLESSNPVAAIRNRTHLGAAGGLDLAALAGRARILHRQYEAAGRKFNSAVSNLLGVGYPELT